ALRVAVAYHSPQVDEIEEEFRALLAELEPQAPAVALYSTLTGARITDAAQDVGYWWRNAREQVQLQRTLATMADDGWSAFVEVSAHPVLAQAVQEAVGGVTVPSVRRGEPEVDGFL